MFKTKTQRQFLPANGRFFSFSWIVLLGAMILAGLHVAAQSPTAPAHNFNVFTLGNFSLAGGHTHGPVAVGGNLTINGNGIVAQQNLGTFEVGGIKIALLVNGQVNYQSGNEFKVEKTGYVKIGTQGSSKAWYRDQKNAKPPIRITPGADYNGSPRIQMQVHADDFGYEVSESVNPVFEGGLFDFVAAINQMQQNASLMGGLTDNATITDPNGNPLGRTNLPSQVKITLHAGANILNLTGAELNKITNFTYNNAPSASQYLIVNVDAGSTFTWNVFTFAGIGGDSEVSKYILFNFYNTQTLTINDNAAIAGTVFAPFADVTKLKSTNIDGQVIAKSYKHGPAGEIHYWPFEGDIPTGTPNPPTALFSINNDKQCLAGNSFSFTNSSTGTGSLSYAWSFGDGATATTEHATHSYASAGTYTVKLVVTNAGGKDSISKVVQVWPAPVTGFTVNNATQSLIGNHFVFTTSNHAVNNTYKWSFGDGNTSNSQNPPHSYAAAGTYTVKQIVTSGNGCKDSTSAIVNVTVAPTQASFTINNDKQCLVGNSFAFTCTSTGEAPMTYKWYFGDGTTSTDDFPVHTYAAAGTYSVKLVVQAAGGKDSVTHTVTVWPAPSAGFTVNNATQPLLGNSFVFTTTNHLPGSTYQWYFGDGYSSTDQNPTHSFAHAGTYSVKQIVTTSNGCKDSAVSTVTVTEVPTEASFTVNMDEQCLNGNSFSFSSTASGSGMLTYLWSFGDGNTSADQNPTHVYAAAGTYTVTLIVNGAGGADTASAIVTVKESAIAGFTVNESVQELTGNSFVFTATSIGASSYYWDFGDNSTSSDVNPVKSYDSAGTYQVVMIVTSASGCYDTATQNVVVLSDSVSSGNDGGVESESMGGLLTQRDFNRIKNSVDARIDYSKAALFTPQVFNAVAKGTKNSQELIDMIPTRIEAGDAVYVSSPTDLLSLTAAVDVLSVDYTRDHKAKAVALGIKTLDRAHSHTKSICDRFRGAELLFVEPVTIQGYEFARFALKRDGGIVEYAIAFVVGKNKSRDHYSLQTNWLLSSYDRDDAMYNFQVWSAHPDHAVQLANEILNNLKKEQEVKQTNNLALPKAYITYGYRDKDNLIVRINNTSQAKSARLVFEERINEDAGLTMMEIPLTLVPGKQNEFVIPIKDGYEYQGSLYLDGILEDEVYLADGNWGIDYDSKYTTVSEFLRGNNKERVYRDGEYPVYRNVTLKAKSKDYVSIYKAIRSGTEKADLTPYKSVRFFAQGNGRVEIRLTRDSIIDWRSQYKTVVSLTEVGKEYTISFEDFLSDKIDAPFRPNDVKTIVFTYYADGGATEDINLKISDVSFSTDAVTATRGLDSRMLTIAPNPSQGKFECRFVSDQERVLQLNIADVTGKVLYTSTVTATMGVNSVPVELNLPAGTVLFVSLQDANDVAYDVQKVIIH